MGLNERRAVEEFKAKEYPQFLSGLKDAIGFEIPVEVKWETLTTEIEGRQMEAFSDYFSIVFSKPAIEAFKSVCIDDMGREAVKSRIKQIVIRNQTNYDGRLNVTFEGDIFCLDGKYYQSTIPAPEEIIKSVLEQNL